MALGRMPRGTTKLVKRIQRFTSPKKSSDGNLKGFFSQLPEDDKHFYFKGRGSKNARKPSRFGKLPGDIPQGCLAVYVGNESRRYVISTNFLAHPLFKQLLKISEEEFGFGYEGGLNIAYQVTLFEHMLWLISTKGPAARASLEDVIDNFESNPCF